MDVFIANEQSDVDISEERFIALARVAAEEEGTDAGAELSVLFVDAEAMAGLREKYLGETGPTDVLAFPMDEPGSEEQALIGDIVICPAVAAQRAAEAGATVVEELDLLFVHGFLHLLGYDHVRPQDARAMRHRERKILNEFYRRGAVIQ